MLMISNPLVCIGSGVGAAWEHQYSFLHSLRNLDISALTIKTISMVRHSPRPQCFLWWVRRQIKWLYQWKWFTMPSCLQKSKNICSSHLNPSKVKLINKIRYFIGKLKLRVILLLSFTSHRKSDFITSPGTGCWRFHLHTWACIFEFIATLPTFINLLVL